MACPMCDKDTDLKYRPFCSKRCADLDLGKWLAGSYAIPSAAENDEEDRTQASEDNARKPH